MRKLVSLSLTAIFLATAVATTSCSKKEESPDPQSVNQKPNPNDPPPPPPPGNDTSAMISSGIWKTNKVYVNGTEDPAHFLKGSTYSINPGGSYVFGIPGMGSAGGTWAFDATGKHKVNFTTSAGPTFTWQILSISNTQLIVEEADDTETMKYEFSH